MLLPILIFMPLLSGFLCFQFSFINKKIPKFIAIITVSTMFCICLYIFIYDYIIFYNNTQSVKLIYHTFNKIWIARFNIHFNLLLDELSFLMIFLTLLLSLISIVFIWNIDNKNNGFFYFNIMFIISSIIGIFLSVDMFLFFLFLEANIIPAYFLIFLWGHKNFDIKYRINIANKFFIYTQISSIILLISIISMACLYFNKYKYLTFDYNLLKNIVPSLPYYIEFILMLGFFISFAIKLPLVPMHGWLPNMHVVNHNSGIVDILSIVIKISVYGILRFNLNLFPKTSYSFSDIAIVLGLINICYGGWLSISQNDFKRLIAYTSISHIGFILIGIYSFNKLSFQGTIIQLISTIISSSAIFLLFGILFNNLKTRDMNKIGGLWNYINWIPGITLFFAIANLGLPGTGNFVGEFMILNGGLKKSIFLIFLATLSLVFSSLYSLIMIQKIFFGNNSLKIYNFVFKNIELYIFIFLIITILFLGLYPQIILNFSNIIINKYNLIK